MAAKDSRVQRLQADPIDPLDPGSYAAFLRMTADVFDISAAPDEIDSFGVGFTAHASRRFVLTEAGLPRLRFRRSPEIIMRSRLEHFVIRLSISGTSAGLAGHSTVEAQAGDLMFIDLSQTLNLHTSMARGPASDVSLWIPRARVLAAFRDENALHGLVIRGSSPAGAIIGTTLLSLREQVKGMAPAEMDPLGDGIVELIARAIAPTLEQIGLSSAPSQLASFVTIRRYIDRNLTTADLDAGSIARSFGLSRASLYRLFEPVGGIASYIRKARLNRAFQEVASAEFSNRRIGQIAFSLGFKNVSAFNRLFHKAYGLSPRAVRQRLNDGSSGALPESHPPDGRSLAKMLAQIAVP